MLESHVVTISRFVVDQERLVPEATGSFTSLLHDIALAAKVIGREVNKAGLVDILGAAGKRNVHGESVQKLDDFGVDIPLANMVGGFGVWCGCRQITDTDQAG